MPDRVVEDGQLAQERRRGALALGRYARIADTMERLFALRGANSVERNDRASILAATDELMRALIARNGLASEQMVSCIFTVTPDLDAEFPAVAARELGLNRVPLLCTREIPVPGSLPRIVRILMHYYAPPEHQSQHVYLNAARALRADLHGAQ